MPFYEDLIQTFPLDFADLIIYEVNSKIYKNRHLRGVRET